MELDIYCDGGARGNPGPAAIGIAVTDSKSEIRDPKQDRASTNYLSWEIGRYIGVATNNQAEYRAVVEALKWLNENIESFEEKPEKINFFLDSSLVVNQLNGKFKIKNNKLRELLLQIRSLENDLSILAPYLSINYNHIPREENKTADKLVNQALNQAEE